MIHTCCTQLLEHVSDTVQMNLRLTYHPLSLYASGMSGLIMSVLLNDADRDRPPKSDSLAPLMATMGSPEPSNFSAYRREEIRTDENETDFPW